MILQLTSCSVDLEDGSVSGAQPSRLTPRELQLLRYLAQRPGQEVSRDVLLHEVFGYHPDARSRAVDKAMSSLRQKVEVDSGAPDHLCTTTGGYLFVPLPAPAVVEPDLFVGRGAELRDLERRMASPGLLSLVGPAGVGKSRLAGRAVRAQTDRPAVICELTPVRTEEDLLRCVAAALGCSVAPSADQLSDQIGVALGSRGGILLLDGFEHLVDHAHRLRAWRRAAPSATLLVTSQRPVGIEGEGVIWLSPLPRAEAVGLLVARARERGIQVEGDPRLAELAERLDDLPLALELAAARLGVLSPGELIARLGARLELLRSPVRDAPPHRATLRGMLDASWALCSNAERTAFAELSVFVGDFELAAAEAVLSAPADGRLAVDVFAELVERSLVQRQSGRFRLLQTLQAYAAERLAALGPEKVQQTEAAHGLWYARRLAPGDPLDLTRIELRMVEHLPSFDDALAACRRAMARRDTEVVLRILGVLSLMFERGGVRADAQALLRSALELPLGLRERAWVRNFLGRSLVFVNMPAAVAEFERARDEAVESGDVVLESRILYGLGTVLGFRGQNEEATACFERGLALTPEGGTGAQHRFGLGQLWMDTGRPLEGLALLGVAEEELARAGHPLGAANARQMAGMTLYILGRHDEARAKLEAARAAFEALQQHEGVLRAEGMLAAVNANRGMLEEAAVAYRRIAERWRAVGGRRGWVAYTTNLADVLKELGRIEESLEMLAQTKGELEILGDPSMTRRVTRLEASCLLAAGRPREALERFGSNDEADLSPEGMMDMLLHAEILLHLGEDAPASALLDEIERGSEGMGLTEDSLVRRGIARLRALAATTR